MRKSLVWIALAALLCGCSSGVNRPVSEVIAVTDSTGVQHLEVTSHSFWFEPNRIVVKAGVPVVLEVRNASLIIPHNFSCDAQEAGLGLDAGMGMLKGGSTLRFTPTKSGEYRFYCDKGSHQMKGMTGTIVVVP